MIKHLKRYILITLLLIISPLSNAVYAEYQIRVPYQAAQLDQIQDVIPEPDLSAWQAFADARGLSYTDFSYVSWNSSNLTTLPTEPYPLNEPSGMIAFGYNQIDNLDGLISITRSSTIYLNNNKFTNVNGLANLTESGFLNLSGNPQLVDVSGLSKLRQVNSNFYLSSTGITSLNGLSALESVSGTFMLSSSSISNIDGLGKLASVGGNLNINHNNIQNVNGLSSLQSVGGTLRLDVNPLTDISGLANVKVSGQILINKNYSGPKLPMSSFFCQEHSTANFTNSNYASYFNVCG